MNRDFTFVPNDHPMVKFALENSHQTAAVTSAFHIFTDGSFKQGYTDKDNVVHPAKAAWSFVVLCQVNHCYCRIGFATDLIEGQLKEQRLNAQTAEAYAVIAVAEYIFSLPNEVPLQLFLHFDASAVGFGACGFQRPPRTDDQHDDLQHHARVMLSLVQQRCQTVQPIHVKSHEGSPYNEMADSIAGARRRGHCPPIKPVLRSRALKEHPCREWAWLALHGSREIPTIEQLLKNENQPQGKGWPDKVFEQPEGTQQCEERYTTWKIASVNVATMGYGEENYSSSSFKTRELIKQFQQESYDFVGLQETRAREDKITVEGQYIRMISAGEPGNAGVELWVNQSLFVLQQDWTSTPT